MSKKEWENAHLCLEKEEYLRLKRDAEAMGLPFSSYVRFFLQNRAPRPPQGPKLTAVLDETAELAQSLQQGLFRGGNWTEEDRRTAEMALTKLRALRLKIMEETMAPISKEGRNGDL